MLHSIFLFSLFVHSALAQAPAGKVEVKIVRDTRSLHEIQIEVEDLMTSDERVEALGILTTRLKDEKREPARSDFRKLQDQISETFLTEKGLQSYELGRSLVFSDMGLAMSRFNEALLLETGNLAVMAALARANLHSGDCASALKGAQRALDLNENYRPTLIIKIQALVCLQKKKEALELLSQKQNEALIASSVGALFARAQLALMDQNFDGANLALTKAKSLDAKMPEIYYWLGQVADQEKKESTIFYRQYIEYCMEPNRDKRRQYDIEPRTCLESKSVEHLLETRTGKMKGS